MADAVASFGIVIEDNVSSASDVAASSLEALHAQIKQDTSALNEMQKAMRNLRGATNGGSEAAQILKAQIEVQRAVIGNAQAQLVTMGGALGVVATSYRNVAGASGLAANASQSEIAAANAAAAASNGAASAARGASAARAAGQQEVAAAQREAAAAAERNAAALAFERGAAQLTGLTVDQLGSTVTASSVKIAAMSSALSRLGEANGPAAAEITKLKQAITEQRGVMVAAQSRYVAVGGDLTKLAKQTNEAKTALTTTTEKMARFGEAAGVVPGPLGRIIQMGGPMRALFSAGGLTGLMILATAAVVAFGVALIATTASLLAYGIAASGAARDQKLMLQGVVAAKSGFDGSAAAASGMAQAVSNVSRDVALSGSEIEQLGVKLAKGGLQGAAFEKSLRAAAVAASAAGPEVASEFVKQAIAINEAGGAVDNLTQKIDQKFGAIAEAKTLAWSNQLAKLKENLGKLFGGLRIEGFLRAVSTITDMFHEQSAVGGALKAIFESLFQPMVDGAANSAPLVKRFIQGIIIAALQLTIVFLKVRNSIRDTFGDSPIAKWFDGENAALTAGKLAFGLFVIVVGVLTIALGALIVKLVILAAPFLAIGAAAFAVGYALGWLIDTAINADWGAIGAGIKTAVMTPVNAVIDWFQGLDFAALGTSMVQGIVGGITSAAGFVVNAVKRLASSAISSFKSTLGIASPSKVFTEFGVDTGQGVAVGLDKSSPAVNAAVSDVVDLTAPALQPPRVDVPTISSPDQARTAVQNATASVGSPVNAARSAVSEVSTATQAVAPNVNVAAAPAPSITLDAPPLAAPVEAPSAPQAQAVAPAAKAQAPASGGKATVTIGNITIQSAATDAKGIALDVRAELERVFADLSSELAFT